VIGCRIIDCEPHLLRAGQYGKWDHDGKWYAVPPGTDLLAGLAKHEVTEHEDGTITVSPSIEVSGGIHSHMVSHWHGYLERGIWREA
jgi:hypothetical protein